jgi:glycosyltransferase involved in cell wall biosynthesis
MQQSLQYLKNEYEKDSFKTWFRKKIIGALIHLSSKRADSVYVQTQWIKERLSKAIRSNGENVYVVEPNANVDNTRYKFIDTPDSYKTFFYPAVASPYKNHMLILESAKKLIDDGINDFKIVFTIGTKSEYEIQLQNYARLHKINVEFCGRLPYEKVLEMYTHSVLIFASDIETFGFPMREMSIIGGPVIVTQRPYAYDVVGSYDNSVFFEHKNADELSSKMKELIEGKFKLSPNTYPGKNKVLINEVINVYTEQTHKKTK